MTKTERYLQAYGGLTIAETIKLKYNDSRIRDEIMSWQDSGDLKLFGYSVKESLLSCLDNKLVITMQDDSVLTFSQAA